jgi:hypothetical protein
VLCVGDERRELHRLTAGVATGIVALAGWGTAAPISLETVSSVESAMSDGTALEIAGAMIAIGLGALVAGAVGWTLAFQRWRPRPIGPHPAPRLPWPLVVAAFAPCLVLGAIPIPGRIASGVYGIGEGDLLLKVVAPADAAYIGVVALATFFTAFLAAHLLRRAIRAMPYRAALRRAPGPVRGR